jgi:O-antigen/teichoic acid export membrane protein
MSRVKTLLNNTLVFTVSEFASKLLAFFMLPVYTRVMTTEAFGASDLINSTVGLLMPIFTLSISNAALRFAMNKDDDTSYVFSFGIKVIFAGFILLILAVPLFLRINIINDYLFWFYAIYITSALSNYLNQFARGINKIKLVGISGVLNTVVVIVSNIILLVVFHLGVIGYLVSFIISYVIGSIVLFVGGGMYRYLTIHSGEKILRKNMLQYSIPFAPNSLSWWLNNTANRYIIIAFCGVSQVGLFSAAARIPTILVTLQNIFLQAWLLSAISVYESEDKSEFFTKGYKFLNITMLLGCCILIAFIKPISSFLLSTEFYIAWKYIPFLLISVIFGALAGFLGSLYSASTKTNMLFVTTLVGGIISIGINFLLVPFFGPLGASIASVLAYMTVWIMRLIDTRRFVELKISLIKDCIGYVLITAQALAIIILPSTMMYVGSLVVFIIVLLLNLEELESLYKMIYSFVNRNKGKTLD